MARYGRWAVRLIGPLLLVYFLSRSNPVQLLASVRGLVLWPAALSFALFPIFIAVKSWRWNAIMRELGLAPPPLRRSMALYTIGLYAGGVTPGQSGDFIKGWYLRDMGLPLAPSLLSIVLDRLFDFVVMAGLSLVGLVVLADLFAPALRAWLQAATVLFALGVFTAIPTLMARRPREWFFDVVTPRLPERMRGRAAELREQFAPLRLRGGPLATLLAASAGSAATTMLRVGLLYLTMPLERIPLVAIVGTTALISILQALPISFAGLGVRETVLIALLQRYGYTGEQALLLSAQFLIINIEHILLGFIVSLRYPLADQGAGRGARPAAEEP